MDRLEFGNRCKRVNHATLGRLQRNKLRIVSTVGSFGDALEHALHQVSGPDQWKDPDVEVVAVLNDESRPEGAYIAAYKHSRHCVGGDSQQQVATTEFVRRSDVVESDFITVPRPSGAPSGAPSEARRIYFRAGGSE